MTTKQRGFSLIELMVAVGIIGIISAIAFPMYTDYVKTARQSVMLDNMQSIRLFEEESRLATGAYQEGTYDPADPDDNDGLKAKIGWEPRTSNDEITYVVDDVTANSFKITATHEDGTEVERTYNRP